MRAALKLAKALPCQPKWTPISVNIDNTSTLSGLTKGRHRNFVENHVVETILIEFARKKWIPTFTYVRSAKNFADLPSRLNKLQCTTLSLDATMLPECETQQDINTWFRHQVSHALSLSATAEAVSMSGEE